MRHPAALIAAALTLAATLAGAAQLVNRLTRPAPTPEDLAGLWLTQAAQDYTSQGEVPALTYAALAEARRQILAHRGPA